MLSFSLSPQTKEMLNVISNEASGSLFLRKRMGLVGDQMLMSVMMRESINQSMASAFPLQWKHFKVDNVGSNQYGYMVNVRPADDVGTYLWYGTLPHYIEALPGYALEFTDTNGEIIYREEVFVAGIKSIKDNMIAIMNEAVEKVILLVKNG